MPGLSEQQQEEMAQRLSSYETGLMGDPTVDDPEGVSKALVHRDVQPALTIVKQSSLLDDKGIGEAFRLAKSLAQSGMYKGANDAELTATQAFAKILIGRDLGISPTRALAAIDIVKGNAQLRGVLLAAFIRESDHYDYEILEHDNTHAKVEFWGISKRTKEWKVLGTTTFSVEDAKKKGLYRAKGQWENWPENMCIWRCISNGVKFWMGDLLKGIPVYTEADSFDDSHVVGRGIGGGNGSGEGPGWQGLDAKQISLVQALIARAERLGHMGFPEESVQVRLALKTPAEVEAYIREGTAILDAMEREETEKAKNTVEGTATEMKGPGQQTAMKVASTLRTGADIAAQQGVIELGHMHVIDRPSTNLRAYYHEHPECGTRYEVPLDSGTAPVEGEKVDCLECGGQIPLGTYRVDPAPVDEVATGNQTGGGNAETLEREGIDLMAKSDALAETNPEEAERLAARAMDLHEQAVALRGPEEPDTLPGF